MMARSDHVHGMSAYAPIADMTGAIAFGPDVPKTDINKLSAGCLLLPRNFYFRIESGHQLEETPRRIPLRGPVFRHGNHGAGERAVGLSQLIQNREVIGVGDRYQVAWDMPLRPVGMIIAAAGDHGR